MSDLSEPTAPDRPDSLPAYVCDALEAQSVDRLSDVIAYADALREHRRDRRVHENAVRRRDQGVEDDHIELLRERGVETDPAAVEEIPPDATAYITIKEPKSGYRYFYWQWRVDDDTWKNKYIGPVDPKE